MEEHEGVIEIVCRGCGHRERGPARSELMAKIRMWNHINHTHPSRIDEFRTLIERHRAEETSDLPRSGARRMMAA